MAAPPPSPHSNDPGSEEETLYRRMLEIRRFEETLLDIFRSGAINGTTHACIGQEAVAVAALRWRREDDWVFSNHRCHGHFLAYGGDPRALFNEIIGDRAGVCQGIGGSQHLHHQRFFSNGILGGMAPAATGVALAEKIGGSGAIALCFLGDGSMGEGIIYETLNIAALWNAPILFVIENNLYAQTTPIALNTAGALADRPRAFGIPTETIEGDDVGRLSEAFAGTIGAVRRTGRAHCLVVTTYRLAAHSKGDDFRPAAEIAQWRSKDPLSRLRNRLDAAADRIDAEVSARMAGVCALPERLSPLSRRELGDDGALLPNGAPGGPAWRRRDAGKSMVNHLQGVFHGLMDDHPEIHLLGEDILDPYGGAFKVYKGLSSRHPDRVRTTPISEAGIVGVANGMALAGLRPIVEIMFGDFSTLILDQLLNHASKFHRMFRRVDCPVIVRMPMGGRRGYGPTHSQTLDRLFLGIAGLVVAACDPIHDQGEIWRRMLTLRHPCVYLENKVLYGQPLPSIDQDRLGAFFLTAFAGFLPTTRLSLSPSDGRADVALIAYGGMVGLAMEAALRLFEEDEVLVDVVVPALLSPLPLSAIREAVADAGAVVVAEEGVGAHGFGAEVLAALAERGDLRGRKARRVAMAATIIPSCARLESDIIPGVDQMCATIREMLK